MSQTQHLQAVSREHICVDIALQSSLEQEKLAMAWYVKVLVCGHVVKRCYLHAVSAPQWLA